MVGLYNAFGKSTVWRHSTWTSLDLPDTNSGMDGESINVVSMVEFWMGGVDKEHLVQVQMNPTYKPNGQLLRDIVSVLTV